MNAAWLWAHGYGLGYYGWNFYPREDQPYNGRVKIWKKKEHLTGGIISSSDLKDEHYWYGPTDYDLPYCPILKE